METLQVRLLEILDQAEDEELEPAVSEQHLLVTSTQQFEGNHETRVGEENLSRCLLDFFKSLTISVGAEVYGRRCGRQLE